MRTTLIVQLVAASIRRTLPPPPRTLPLARIPAHRVLHLLTHARDGHAHHGRDHLPGLPSHALLPPLRARDDGRNRVQAAHGPSGARLAWQDLVLDVCDRLCARVGRCVAWLWRGRGAAVARVDEPVATGGQGRAVPAVCGQSNGGDVGLVRDYRGQEGLERVRATLYLYLVDDMRRQSGWDWINRS